MEHKPASPDRRRLRLEIVHGEVVDAARVDLWASSLGQVDTRSSARTQNPYPLAEGRDAHRRHARPVEGAVPWAVEHGLQLRVHGLVGSEDPGPVIVVERGSNAGNENRTCRG